MKLIPLTQGKFAQVDDQDFEYLNQFKWGASKPTNNNNYYATRTFQEGEKRKQIKMHREILGLTDPKQLGDHKDNDGLNNQRNNLRACNYSENARNKRKSNNKTSKYKGVCFYKRYGKWMTQVRVNNKVRCFGYFKTEIEAAKMYDTKAKEVYGSFANLNFK